MAISRAQMGRQLKGNRMKKRRKTKKMGLGGLAAIKEGGAANVIPTVAIVESIKSGEPEGMLRMTPIGQELAKREARKESKKPKRVSGASQNTPAAPQNTSGRMERPQLPSRGMKAGGRVGRGDGVCRKGKTKGRMV